MVGSAERWRLLLLLCLLGAGDGLLSSGHTTGVQYQIPCGEYLPTTWERLSSVANVTGSRCAVDCVANVHCNSFQFEKRTGDCHLSRVTDGSCSANPVLPGTVFYQESCPFGWWLFEKHCYGFMSDVELSWNDSKAVCEKLGAHLVSLQSSEELDFIDYNLQNSPSLELTWKWWTSGRRDAYEPNWNDSANWFWDDFSGGSMASYHPWGEGDPNNGNGNEREDRALLLRSGSAKFELADGGESLLLRHICELE